MAFADVDAKTTTVGFSAEDRTIIIDAMRTLYDGSSTAKTMVDAWIAVSGNAIMITPGGPSALPNTGQVKIDFAEIEKLAYLTNNGRAVEFQLEHVIAHELVHALTGRLDVKPPYILDYAGDTVSFTNIILEERDLPARNSYPGANYETILKPGFEYTNGAEIDRSVAADVNTNSSLALISDDLLVGGPSANTLESGLGNDFLFGGGGDDLLNGGLFGTDTVVLTGKPVDYDVRLNTSGTWTSRHVRGAKDEGADTFKNLEKVMFEGGQTFDLEENGLTFQTDFAFVVDQTGSMFDDIDAVKASATAVIDALFAGDTTDARVGVVGFRDNTIGEPTQVVLPFTDQDNFADRKAAALAAINSLGASGGGDFAETAFDGLLKALNGSMGDWREGAGTKRVALFTDASAKDAFLLPTVLGFARDIGADISASSSEALGTFGTVDTFELSVGEGQASGVTPESEGDTRPEYVPSDDPIQPPRGTATVQIFTIFVETFTTPDPNLVEVSESSGGDVLTAATPEEVVKRLFEVISGPENDPPIANNDAAQTFVGEAVTIQVTANDTDPDGTIDPSTVTVTDPPDNGTASVNASSGDIVYTPAEGFDGTDTLLYTVKDNEGATSNQATVSINVVCGVGINQTGTISNDTLIGTNGKDTLRGLTGNDRLEGGACDDELYGDLGNDRLLGGNGDDYLRGDAGYDTLEGGPGADTLEGGASGEPFFGGSGFPNVGSIPTFGSFPSFPGLTSALSGDFFVDLEPDIPTGGPGNDKFVFRASVAGGAATLLGPDEITDFEGAGQPGGDVIDVSAIDAGGLFVAGDQAFTFASGPGAGNLWVEDAGPDARVLMDTDGFLPDFVILLRNVDHSALRAEDFVL